MAQPTIETAPRRARFSPQGIGAALSRQLAGERERWILWLPVALGAGVFCYFALAEELPAATSPALVAIASLAVALSARHYRLLVAVIALATAALGFAVAQWRTHDVAAPVIAQELRHRTVVGDIATVEPRDNRFRLTLDVASIEGLDTVDLPARVRLSVSSGQYDGVRPGQTVAVRATLRPPPGPAIPGGFDFRRIAWYRQLGGVGFATGPIVLVPVPAAGERGLMTYIADRIQTARLAITERVAAALPGVPGAVAAALMVGERGAIPADVRTAMQQSGLAHLLAISGLHVGLVAGFVFFALRASLAAWPRVALRYPVKKWAALAALAASAAYLVLAGATVPTQRAFIMTALVLLAVMIDRRGISMRLVAWAATLVLLIRPEALLSVSFQMSFAAVVALVAVYETVGDRLRRGLGERGLVYRMGVYLVSVLLTTGVATLATAPFAVFHFNQIAAYSVLANLVAIPVAAFWVMPLIVVALVLMPFGLDSAVMPALGFGVEIIVAIASAVSSLPGANLNIAAPPAAGLGLVVIGGLWLCLWRTRWRLAGLIPAVAGLATILTVEPPDILISDDGRLVGLLATGNVLLVSQPRAGRFVRDQWLRRTGASTWRAFPSPEEGEVAGLRCDRVGCIFEKGGRTVALVADARALAEDCRTADILLTRLTAPRGCTGPMLVIDRHALRAGGSHTISWSAAAKPTDLIVATSADLAGHRLWLGAPKAQ